jgi:hypothetical protein
LKYVRADNPSGTAWGTPVIVNAGTGGPYGSMTVIHGNPAISYFDLHLRYVRAGDADGTAWGTPAIVDGADDVGRFSSLALVNGNPAIAYYDSTNGDLKYAWYF